MQAPTDRPGTDRTRTDVDATIGLERDELFGLLQVERRRHVVRHLGQYVDETVSVDALAAAVARREQDSPAKGLDGEVRQRVAVTLDHSDLPALDAAGVVDYDRERGRVTPTPLIEGLQPYLEVDDGSTSGENERGLALALTGFAGGSLATLLALRNRTAIGAGIGLLAVLTLLWTGARRQHREQI